VTTIQWVVEGAVCKPNISAAGRKRRILFGWISAALGIGLVALAIGLHWHWYLRATLFFPAALAATGFLQARRNTCVAHAMKGTFEHEDFTATKAPDDEVAASRKVARTIQRDAVLIGLASAAFGAATAFLA
jgi:hypothetical protein